LRIYYTIKHRLYPQECAPQNTKVHFIGNHNLSKRCAFGERSKKGKAFQSQTNHYAKTTVIRAKKADVNTEYDYDKVEDKKRTQTNIEKNWLNFSLYKYASPPQQPRIESITYQHDVSNPYHTRGELEKQSN